MSAYREGKICETCGEWRKHSPDIGLCKIKKKMMKAENECKLKSWGPKEQKKRQKK